MRPEPAYLRRIHERLADAIDISIASHRMMPFFRGRLGGFALAYGARLDAARTSAYELALCVERFDLLTMRSAYPALDPRRPLSAARLRLETALLIDAAERTRRGFRQD